MIQLDHASRWYGQVIGLNDVTCSIGPGITALLGQNGAGKSTLMRLITGQIKPTTGSVSVLGHEPFANAQVYRKLGYCPEIDNFYEQMSGREFVQYLTLLSGIPQSRSAARTDELMEVVGMTDRCDRKIAGYSKGMRQRIKLAQALISNPEIILLDEPLNGLDPLGRYEFMEMLARLAEQGKAVIVSSHILYEVEQLTKNILLLHRGRLLATGDLRTIRGLIDRHPHRIRIQTPDPRSVGSVLMTLNSVISMQFGFDGELELECRNPEQFYSSLAELALKHNLPIVGFSSPDNNLEAIFQYLVGA